MRGRFDRGKRVSVRLVAGIADSRPQRRDARAGGHLAIRPATLAQAADDDKVLRRMDADDQHAYGVKASQLTHVVALFEASPPYLARRMKSLESQLTGARKMVLTTAPSTTARRWREAKHIVDARLWSRPFQVLQIRSHLVWPAVQALLGAALPFYMVYEERVISREQRAEPAAARGCALVAAGCCN